MTASECSSCHATDGRPHTDYCRLGEGDGWCGITKPNGMACLEPDGHGHQRMIQTTTQETLTWQPSETSP